MQFLIAGIWENNEGIWKTAGTEQRTGVLGGTRTRCMVLEGFAVCMVTVKAGIIWRLVGRGMVATGKDAYVLIAVSWQSYPEYVREGGRVVPHVRDSYTERKKNRAVTTCIYKQEGNQDVGVHCLESAAI